jgi:hypothetical protein
MAGALQEGALVVCFKMLPPGRVLSMVLLRVFTLQVEMLRERSAEIILQMYDEIFHFKGGHMV